MKQSTNKVLVNFEVTEPQRFLLKQEAVSRRTTVAEIMRSSIEKWLGETSPEKVTAWRETELGGSKRNPEAVAA
jgi:hypothetical protein